MGDVGDVHGTRGMGGRLVKVGEEGSLLWSVLSGFGVALGGRRGGGDEAVRPRVAHGEGDRRELVPETMRVERAPVEFQFGIRDPKSAWRTQFALFFT